MARKSSIDRLSSEVKAHIERRLAEGRMTLDELIAELRSRFPEQAADGELPSRSAVGRYGQKLQQRLAAIKASTEAARMISEHAGDEKDTRSEAVLALIQTEMFDSIISLQEATGDDVDPAERMGLLSSAAKNIATMTRASIALKKHQAEVAERVAAKLAELEAESQSGNGRRFDPETLRIVREEIYGIVGS